MTNYVAAQSQEANSTTAGAQWNPRISALAGGGWVVAWNTDGAAGTEVHAQVFDASGAKSGGEVTVFSAAMNPPGTSFRIGDVAGLTDGSFVVTADTEWLVSPPQAAPYQLAVFGQRVSASGQMLGSPTTVESHQQDNDLLYAGSAVALASGGWEAILQDASRVPPFVSGSSLHAFDGSGNVTGTGDLAGFDSPVVSRFANGNILQANINWSPGPTTISWQVVTPAGQALATARTSTQGGTVDQFVAATAVLSNGLGLVVYGQDEISARPTVSWHVQFVDDQGNAVGPDHVMDLEIGGTAIRATGLADGGFLVTWTSAYEGDSVQLLGQHFDADANPAGAVQVLDPDVAAQATGRYGEIPYRIVANADGGFEVVTGETHATTSTDINIAKFVVADAGSGDNIDVNGGITTIPEGNHTITGSSGLDQIAFAGAHTEYAVTHDSVSGPQGTDTLSGIERIRFSDGFAIALDVNGDAGQAYRLYQAAFDRAPDLAGLGFQMNDLDMGYSLVHVAQNFIDSPEFQAKYGPGLSNEQFITLLYENVLGREPEQAGLQYHMNEFAQGDTRANMLTHFSESPENQALVVAQIQDGMLYIPYA